MKDETRSPHPVHRSSFIVHRSPRRLRHHPTLTPARDAGNASAKRPAFATKLE